MIFTDGGCRNGHGGWAYYTIDGDTEIKRSGYEANTTNNRMELRAVIEALRTMESGGRMVEIYSDSIYVVKGATVWMEDWIARGWTTSNNRKKLIPSCGVTNASYPTKVR